MTRYQGGSMVPGGYFFDLRHWSFKAVSGDQGQLPGDATAKYVKVPLVAVIPGVLIVSLAFLVFFPLIGFALAGQAAFNALRGVAKNAADATLAASMTPGEPSRVSPKRRTRRRRRRLSRSSRSSSRTSKRSATPSDLERSLPVGGSGTQ